MKHMKRFLLLLILLLPPSSVTALELSVIPYHATYQSDNLDNDLGIRVQLGHKNYYLWGSMETPLLRFGGQQCVDIQLLGLGWGVKTKSYGGFSLFIDGGYFLTDYKTLWAFHFDGAHYAFSTILGISTGDSRYYFWDHYDYRLKDGFGGAIGMSYSKVFFEDHLSLGVMVGYRYLRLEQSVWGWNGTFDPSQPHWEVFRYQDFSSIYGGIVIRVGK